MINTKFDSKAFSPQKMLVYNDIILVARENLVGGDDQGLKPRKQAILVLQITETMFTEPSLNYFLTFSIYTSST